jgi:hypothetical protein
MFKNRDVILASHPNLACAEITKTMAFRRSPYDDAIRGLISDDRI